MNRQLRVDLKHHRRLRAVLTSHQNRAVQSVPRTTFRKWAQTFGLVEGDKLLLESEGELTILLDFLIDHHRQRGKTLVQKYLAKLPLTDEPEEKLVRPATNSWADQSAKAFSFRGWVESVPALILALSFWERRKIKTESGGKGVLFCAFTSASQA
jgi:hypothetical protein